MSTAQNIHIRDIKYLFIDGGHLRDYFSRSLREWAGEVKPTDIDFSILIPRTKALKSFYYDCQDETQLPDEYFIGIRRVSGSHVRYGTLKGKSNKKREPRQKEVDILLAVDMMNHAIRRNMGEAILLAGDMDFVPVVESLVEMGCFVTVMADGNHVAQELKEAADDFRELTFKDYYSYASLELQKKYPIPSTEYPQLTPIEQGYTLVKGGECNSEPVELYTMRQEGRPARFYLYQSNYNRFTHRPYVNHQFDDLARLELFCKLEYGGIRWEAEAGQPAQSVKLEGAKEGE